MAAHKACHTLHQAAAVERQFARAIGNVGAFLDCVGQVPAGLMSIVETFKSIGLSLSDDIAPPKFTNPDAVAPSDPDAEASADPNACVKPGGSE